VRRKDQPPPLEPGDRVRFGRHAYAVREVYWCPRFGWRVAAERPRSRVNAPVADFRWAEKANRASRTRVVPSTP